MIVNPRAFPKMKLPGCRQNLVGGGFAVVAAVVVRAERNSITRRLPIVAAVVVRQSVVQ
jgi:hypothetical protein